MCELLLGLACSLSTPHTQKRGQCVYSQRRGLAQASDRSMPILCIHPPSVRGGITGLLACSSPTPSKKKLIPAQAPAPRQLPCCSGGTPAPTGPPVQRPSQTLRPSSGQVGAWAFGVGGWIDPCGASCAASCAALRTASCASAFCTALCTVLQRKLRSLSTTLFMFASD